MYDFGPGQIADTENLIATENADAVSAGNYVDVALLTPLTMSPRGEISSSGIDEVGLDRIVDELRGAYLAQRFYNSSDEPVKIRLLLANEGSQEQALANVPGPLVDELARLTVAPHPLVALVGMGISLTQTRNAARYLGGVGIAMIGSVTTADQLDSATSGDLFRVVPSVASQVSALANYLSGPRAIHRAVLVWDNNAVDLYTKDLRNDFKATFGQSLLPIEDGGAYSPNETVPGTFSNVAAEVCDLPEQHGALPAILYAGRESVLGTLIAQIQGWPSCDHRGITVVTGSDANALPPSDTNSQAGAARVSVLYSNIVNPERVNSGFFDPQYQWLGPGAAGGEADPWMIATYDAMTAAWSGIKYAEDHPLTPGTVGQVTAASVATYIRDLSGPDKMTGVTGTFSINGAYGDLFHPDVPIELIAGQNVAIQRQ